MTRPECNTEMSIHNMTKLKCDIDIHEYMKVITYWHETCIYTKHKIVIGHY